MAKNFGITPGRGNASELKRIMALQSSFFQGINTALTDSGSLVVASAQKFIKDPPKSGIVYTRRVKGRKIRHQASAPGQAPANMTGKLAASIEALTKGHTRLTIGVGAPYGGFLEGGTPKMEPRPYLGKAEQATRRNLKARLVLRVKREVES